MNKIIKLLLSGLTLLATQVVAQQAMDHSKMGHGVMPDNMANMVHDYDPVQVPEGVKTPRLSLQFYRDTMSGVNLHINLQDYALEPPYKREETKLLNGHAHLYVNGKKIQRLYGVDVHIPAEHFKSGINLVLVSLNDHDHAVWQLDESKQLLASSFINLDLDKFVLHSFTTIP